jgi:hypothetical protein
VTKNGLRDKKPLVSEQEQNDALDQHFGVIDI